ncbi:MAG: hypothetical protein A2W90_12715 [Bacteroidetes bacterium GWF2_42_66]|nr:MAG: hypothetical protein A2W92_22710 [Bacteroidetes bacterium GWA2_42_15]OFY00086.1 MAG: hypothetical protein A2W89_17700 [Bacteroidetes bacterium GWE2_42_39]OFY40229.1 MAG: hypothetical protein A2W90_12715 [Bacteroidetes bacterium GWF2_42_66]HBL74064.1 hypothetical protein [Prolixibacteraceae bacterium]HCR89785.1 hypothetical protein [Prolixibacteraceae bacterium]
MNPRKKRQKSPVTGSSSASVLLTTGELDLLYRSGAIRRIKHGNTEIIRMIYSAVRDRNWGTIEPGILKESIIQEKDRFEINIWVVYQKNEIHFEAGYKITGAGGHLRFEMDGEAKSTFHTNRIGFCILHPITECAGKPCVVVHPDGSSDTTVFPEQISPHQPMMNIRSMRWQPAEGLNAELDLEGDIFEMEDQRNWTDASYKTYCTPLDLPFPRLIEKGTKIKQSVDFILKSEKTELITTEKKAEVLSFSWDESKVYPLPSLGTCQSSRQQGLSENEIKILKRLPLGHYRVELKLYGKEWKKSIKQAADESRNLGWPLFLVFYFSENNEIELIELIDELRKYSTILKFCFAVRENHLPDNQLNRELERKLRSEFPALITGTGVNAYFAELNRNHPQTRNAGFVNFAISPQVHAFDNLSLVENLEAQSGVVKSAKMLFPDKEIVVSPVTLKQRFNVVATGDEPELLPRELPAQVDIRQRTDFAAAWTLGSLKNLTEAGARLITFYETVGWRGLVQGDFPPELPEKFGARPGELFPVFHLFNELDGFQEVVLSESSSPLTFTGLVLKNGNFRKILLASFSETPIEVNIDIQPELMKRTAGLKNKTKKIADQKVILQPYEIIVLE